LLILWLAAFVLAVVSFLVSFGMTVALANTGRRQPTVERTEVMSERGVNYFISPAEHTVLRTMKVTASILHPVALIGGLLLFLAAWRTDRATRMARESTSSSRR
jgi:hypothetical protein